MAVLMEFRIVSSPNPTPTTKCLCSEKNNNSRESQLIKDTIYLILIKFLDISLLKEILVGKMNGGF